MPGQGDTPRGSDDLETAERKSKTVDERIGEHRTTDAVPEMELPGVIGRGRPPGPDSPGPGEIVLEQEAKAQRKPTARG